MAFLGDPQGISRKYSAIGLHVSLGQMSAGPPTVHSHASPLLSFTLKGRCDLKGEGKTLEGEAGTLAIQPAGFPHAHLVDQSIVSLCAGFEAPFISLLGGGADILTRPAVIGGRVVDSLIRRLTQEMRVTDSCSGIVMQGLFMELLGETARRDGKASSSEPPPWLANAREIMHDEYLEQHSIGELAARLGVAASYFCRTFRVAYGVSPGSYLRSLRLDAALRLLLRTDKPINLIAADSGYSDQAHFSRDCRRTTGLSPTQYRKNGHQR